MQRYPGDTYLNVEIPFSILGRIGGDATADALHRGTGFCAFQYPRSDRRRCNYSEGYDVAEAVGRLSVSSVGSEAMQRRPENPTPFCGLPFQYPRSDRRRCNRSGSRACPTRLPLSVSSVGSEAMQPSGGLVRRRSAMLSVSSVGSEAMQRSSNSISTSLKRTFSILGRIGGDATDGRARDGHARD